MPRRFTLLVMFAAFASGQAPPPAKPEQEPSRRIELNLLGQTDTAAGESRRNENIQFNLIDNNALKELHLRLGATATIVREFRPESGYFAAEFGNAPSGQPHLAPAMRKLHGRLFGTHQNSVFTARSFFQVGGVQPARENHYGADIGLPAWRGAFLGFEVSQQKLRGSVNGNVLVPRPDERTALAADPAVRAIVQRFLDAYPRELPNRTDINPRALNTNAPQTINNDSAGARVDAPRGRDRFAARYLYTSQHVEAFQFVAGQNPDTDTRAHTARVTWARQWSAATLAEFTAGFDRIASLLVPEPNAVGPMISVSGLEGLGPLSGIPIDRAQNLFRYAGQARTSRGGHAVTAGFHALRRQLNGTESDTHRGYFSFGNDFGRDSIANLRLGIPTQHIVAIGNVTRGFRNLELQWYAGDAWKARPGLTLHYGLRYQPVTRPREVNGFNRIEYGADWNNVAPYFGLARALPGAWGVMRANYGLQYGEIYPVTYQQVRFTPPWNRKIVVTAPSLLNPLESVPNARTNLYLMDRELATPYEHHYNLSWEREIAGGWHVQLGYVGSRGHKLLVMWYLNRAQPVPGIPQTTATINERRADPGFAEKRLVVNGSRGYYDAGRASLVVPRWRGFSFDASYWFSKALDLGSSFTNTAFDADSRIGRSQWEYEAHHDMKGPSPFDQPHAFLWRAGYDVPAFSRVFGGWTVSAVTLLKSGTPFNVITGADGPGFGNVDGNGGDRPHLTDPSILGRTVGDPDTAPLLLPRAAFAYMRPDEKRGNLGRNTFRKGGIRNVNAALARAWTVRGEKRITFRAESINLFNTPQFAEPGAELASQNFGHITNTLNDGRAFRFTVGLGF